MLPGQIFGMNMFRSEFGAMTPFLLVMTGFWVLNILLSLMLKESRMIVGS
jgi:hypothetical protein